VSVHPETVAGRKLRGMSATTHQMITGVDFAAIPTADLAAAAEFYGDKLGLRRSVYMPDRGFAEFETGNLTLSVLDPEKMGMEFRKGTNSIALHVDDVAAARQKLESRGVAFHGDIFDSGVCHMTFFNDPDGNELMLHHRYAPRQTDL
jgi:predicted enzyme related to lactoylglutathione lyase